MYMSQQRSALCIHSSTVVFLILHLILHLFPSLGLNHHSSLLQDYNEEEEGVQMDTNSLSILCVTVNNHSTCLL